MKHFLPTQHYKTLPVTERSQLKAHPLAKISVTNAISRQQNQNEGANLVDATLVILLLEEHSSLVGEE